MKSISEKDAQKIAADFVKKRKDQEDIDISYIEEKDDVWVVSGTCPIDLQGHPWTEKFEVTVDKKGEITSTDFSLL